MFDFRKLRMTRLTTRPTSGEKFASSAVLIQITCVTDRQTDGRTDKRTHMTTSCMRCDVLMRSKRPIIKYENGLSVVEYSSVRGNVMIASVKVLHAAVKFTVEEKRFIT